VGACGRIIRGSSLHTLAVRIKTECVLPHLLHEWRNLGFIIGSQTVPSLEVEEGNYIFVCFEDSASLQHICQRGGNRDSTIVIS
jgi:hypothetical protein